MLVTVITLLLASGRELDDKWAIDLFGHKPQDSTELTKADELARRCNEVAATHGLSPREREILGLLVQHKTSPEIAQEIFISAATAKTHARNIYRKLDVHSREELCALVGE